jgi:FtsH-binding integral membrane protein
MMRVELRTRSIGYKIGWWVLVVIAGLSIVGYLAFVGTAATDMEVAAFFALAGINIYALSVLLTAYRQGEPWAWWVTWVQVAVYGITILYAPDLGPWYAGPVIAIAIAQLLTRPAFRSLKQPWVRPIRQ